MRQKQELHGISEEPNFWECCIGILLLSAVGLLFFGGFFGY